MFSDEQKNDWHVQMMELLEVIDRQIAMTHSVEAVPAEYATQALWESIREQMAENRALLKYLRESIRIGSKVIDNDALVDHTLSVTLAP